MPSETADVPVTGRRWSAILVGVPLLTAAYFVAGKLGLSLAVANESATTVWPPTGIALAALLVFGVRLWPGVFLGALLVNLTTSGSWPASIGISVGNTLEAVVGFLLVERYANGRRAFDRVGDVFRFTLLAALFSTMLSATVGVFSLSASGSAQSDLSAIWLAWWLGDLGGALIIAPFLILWSSWTRPRWDARTVLEGILLLAALVAISSVVFGDWLPFSPKNFAIGFLCIPVVLWSSFRIGARQTSAVIVLLAGVALWGTLHQIDPYGRQAKIQTLVILQAFLGVIAFTALAASAAVEERKRSAEELKRRLEEVAQLNGRLDSQKEDLAVYQHMLTHDISNISMAVLGLLDRLLMQADGPLVPKQSELLLRLNRQTHEMNRISENARALLTLREHGLPAAGPAMALTEALNRALSRVRDLHFDRPFQTVIDCPPDARLAGVPLIDSVLFNLCDNAVRHSLKGVKTELEIVVRTTDAQLAIEFRGGLPPSKELVEQLLEGNLKRRRAAPHGIGLILVREIILRAGGSVVTKTVPGPLGDRFAVCITLPALPPVESRPADDLRPPTDYPLRLKAGSW